MSAIRRVLLVDDEPQIVAGLQRLLRRHRADWVALTATSGSAALALMAEAPFDVIVSDMRMPEMDGATLLAEVKATHPTTMRIVLSGQTESQMAVRAVAVAHQFLSKPAETQALIESLARMIVTKDAIADARVLAAVGGLDSLPTPSALYRQITTLVEREDASPAAVAKLIEGDPAIVLRLLQIVNSTFFGLRRKICSVADAVAYLGLDMIKSLCMSVSIVNALPVRARHFDPVAFQTEAFALANMARTVAGPGELSETCFAAGLLNDIGKQAMASAMPDVYDEIAARAQENAHSFEDEERRTGACGHAKIGAYLLELWGLPYAVVETLVNHSEAPPLSSELRSPDVIRIARRLLGRDGVAGVDDERDYLGRVGLLERLPELVNKAQELSGRS